jgi:BASS family bile acid:Na+ symporter
MFLLALLAIFISPPLLKLVLPAKVPMVVPYGSALLFFLAILLVPLLAGMLLLAKAPGAATKLSKLTGLVGIVAFVGFMVVTGAARQLAVGQVGQVAVGAMVLFILATMAVGWLMAGPARDARRILASATSMRNAALCIAIVESSAPGHAVLVHLIAFSLLMVPTNMLFSVYNSVQEKRRARKAT